MRWISGLHDFWYRPLSEQLGIEDKGGTMRLGGYPCRLVPGTKGLR